MDTNTKLNVNEAKLKLLLDLVLRPVKIIALIVSRANREVGHNREIPEKKHLTTRKQNLFFLTCDPS